MNGQILVSGKQDANDFTLQKERNIEPTSVPVMSASPPSSSAAHVEIYGLVDSQAMSLIDESAKDLLDALKKSIDVEDKVLAAHAIEKLIRLKFEVALSSRG